MFQVAAVVDHERETGRDVSMFCRLINRSVRLFVLGRYLKIACDGKQIGSVSLFTVILVVRLACSVPTITSLFLST